MPMATSWRFVIEFLRKKSDSSGVSCVMVSLTKRLRDASSGNTVSR